MFLRASLARDDRGIATATVLIFVVILASMAVAILNLNRTYSGVSTNPGASLDPEQRRLLFYNAINIVESNIYVFGQHDDAWWETVARNQAAGRMTCINSASACVRPNMPIAPATNPANPNVLGPMDVVLYYPNGTQYYSYSTQGFRLDGTVCTYNPAAVLTSAATPAAQRNCVFRVRIRWFPACPTTCMIPPSKMTFYLEYESPPVTAGGVAFDSLVTNKIIAPKNAYR